MRIPKRKYHQYISSDKWLQKREEVFIYKWRKCEKCWKENNLQIHHWTYVRLWNELMQDLFVLCDSCHVELHELCWLRDLLRSTKRFIEWLPYEKRTAEKVRKAYRMEFLKEHKRVRREARKRKKERERLKKIANSPALKS